MQHVSHRASDRTNVEVARIKSRLARLDAEIKAYPHWGAKLTALDEERRGLLRTLESLTREPWGSK